MGRLRRCVHVVRSLLLCGILASCAGSRSTPQLQASPLPQFDAVTNAQQVSLYNPHAKDEDPTMIRAGDGRYLVCWFSNRNGHDNLYLRQSIDGRRWDQPIHVTRTNDRDYYPSLHETPDGRFHLAWFRIHASPPFNRHIWYTSSEDGVHWDPRHEVEVTNGWVSDWAPTIWSDTTGQLFIAFASKRHGDESKEIYVVRSSDRGATWSAPVKAAGVNAPLGKDDFPYVARQDDGTLVMAWTRSSKRGGLGMFDDFMNTYVAASDDGLAWRDATDLTHDDPTRITDILPFLFPRHNGALLVGWTSTRTDQSGELLTMPVRPADRAGELPSVLLRRPGQTEYTARVAPMEAPGEYLVVWVTRNKKSAWLMSQIVREHATSP